MSRSILQPKVSRKNKECYVTGRTDNCHKHHIFPGNNRAISDKHGFWVYLHADIHNGNDPGAVHNNPNEGYDLLLKQRCQRAYEESGHSREEFRKLIGRSYL